MDIGALFDVLWSDIKDDDLVEKVRPLLAHYTSLQGLESILSGDQIWFSNPLFMNDLDEVISCIRDGSFRMLTSEKLIEACGSPGRAGIFRKSLDACRKRFATEHMFDTYLFCFSEHDPKDYDGILSMWRGYASNATGAALVVDTSKITFLQSSALIVHRVTYASPEEQGAWVDKKIDEACEILRAADLPDEQMFQPAQCLFERLKRFALFTKHVGFKEEREWRVAYTVGDDPDIRLKSMFSYHIGPRGIEPKLKFKIAPADGLTDPTLSLAAIVNRILIGPANKSMLAVQTVQRMLDCISKPQLRGLVHASRIPYRAF